MLIVIRSTGVGLLIALAAGCGRSYEQSALDLCNAPPPRGGLTWREARGGRICIFARSDVPSLDSERLIQLMQEARSHAVSLMGVPDTVGFMRVLLLPSRAAMAAHTGREVNALSGWGQRTIIMVYGESPNRLAIRHETMHIMNEMLWAGQRPNPWVQEGLGVLAGGQCSGYAPRAVGAFLLAAGRLPSLRQLRDQFWELDEITGHLASASFMAFVRATHGPEGLRTLWSDDLVGLAELAQESPKDLEAAWHGYLVGTPQDARLPDWSPVEGGCYWVEDAA